MPYSALRCGVLAVLALRAFQAQEPYGRPALEVFLSKRAHPTHAFCGWSVLLMSTHSEYHLPR